ncbi:MAG: hypothetical protein CML66_25960 [Rhodobacteraceae bacterium]|nr:hypothetical protein [Paracoccaceae bacterium]MAY43898.1 hypothetical protein [Paracoccaceae bacterium]|tara:strand:+ start:623 stop:841 length:219 start_codon:yes stop_codon:yes gene_type:complete
MKYAPEARIVIRYIVGMILGIVAAIRGVEVQDAGPIIDAIANNELAVTLVASFIGMAVEFVYRFAKRRGWAT